MSFESQKINDLSYGIRKRQRGLIVAYKTTGKLGPMEQFAIKEIFQMKNELEQLTGSRTPKAKKWAV